MSVINATPLLAAAGGDYQISRSVRLRSSASGNLSRTVGTPTNKDVWTISGWVKYSAGGKVFPLFSALAGGYYEFIEINTSGDFYWITRNSAGSVFKQYYAAAGQRLFRDPSAWYHFVVRKTSALTLQFYVNGEEFSLTAQTVGSPSSAINTASTLHYLGYQAFNAEYADGYLTEVNFIDGQALTPSSFGETDSITGVWKPKKYTGTYGTNGFYLNFSDNSSNTATTIGRDSSGNGNNWTPNNISVTSGVTYDSMIDVPTLYADGGNGRGNYAVLNPLHQAGTATPSFGNLRVTQATNNAQVASTFGMTTGKWYYEHTMTAIGGEQSVGIGLAPVNGFIVGGTTGQYGYYTNGNKYIQGTASAYGATYTNGDVIGVAYDADAGSLTFYKNGTSQGVATTGLSGTFFALAATRTAGGTNISDFNFGQRPFAYTPPTGFKALNTQNLPEPTIKKGNQYFDATLYTGNGSTQSIVNAAGFQPDLVWLKARSIAESHELHDAVRGASNLLKSNSTAAEVNAGNTLTSFNSNGFSLGSSTEINTNAATFVGWQWKESASAGFDIVTYTGTGSATTFAHSLGVAPKLMIIKARSLAGSGWTTYSSVLGAGQFLSLNTTAAATSSIYPFNNTAPTSSVFSVGPTGNGTNNSGVTYVAYLFAEVAGFSKFGSYTGNGSADGVFVYCGFRPRWIMFKCSSAGDADTNWLVYDTARDTYNGSIYQLLPNLSNAEAAGSGSPMDILSNGFKFRNGDANKNGSGRTFIFAAFAEHPFKNSLAR